ncbi:MAG: MerR family transcriptional regulator [Candidatus Marinimicrobia bacterium]|nr:MerR family transcriptional regulator [Candidatus Neomarinimicrobiota bacterium]|tara:strand:+ start:67 stop:1602 length:1536 start_codon:yes stop_codon:yes gene_type:complete
MKKTLRNTHFIGYKIRKMRKNLGMTLEDLCVRCIQLNSSTAPSVSYLSLIETGHRKPSAKLINMLSSIFQKTPKWFLDETIKIDESKNESVGFSLEPKFLFSKELLSKSIPTLLSQTGTSGRHFAHLLIRAYQEKNNNQFHNIEKIADSVGKKIFPITLDEIFKICKNLNLEIEFFNKSPLRTINHSGREITTLIRSFYEYPNKIYINKRLEKEPDRLKYDLATMIGHKVLHNGDGILSINASGGEIGGSPQPYEAKSGEIHQKDILYAWRDFESSYFAGALLCPKLPFRYFLLREAYNINSYKKINITPGVFMRRITSVSNHKEWHYFDVYPPGYLRTSYRGDNISSPWANMRLVTNPCKNWAMFGLLSSSGKNLNQISIMKNKNQNELYASTALKIEDAANNKHVLSLGFNIGNLLDKHKIDSKEIISSLKKKIKKSKSPYKMNGAIKKEMLKIGNLVNISWFLDAVNKPITIICPTSEDCQCNQSRKKRREKISWLNEVKENIIKKNI